MNRLVEGAFKGAAAGAAGTTALNVVGYLDMVVRARPASTTPEGTVVRLSQILRLPIPGSASARANRIAGLAPLTGIVAGLAVGALLGTARSAGWRAGPLTDGAGTTLAALIGTNGPMTVLGVTDPRTWSALDWVSDVVPHLAYAAVTVAILEGLDSRSVSPAQRGGRSAGCRNPRSRATEVTRATVRKATGRTGAKNRASVTR